MILMFCKHCRDTEQREFNRASHANTASHVPIPGKGLVGYDSRVVAYAAEFSDQESSAIGLPSCTNST